MRHMRMIARGSIWQRGYLPPLVLLWSILIVSPGSSEVALPLNPDSNGRQLSDSDGGGFGPLSSLSGDAIDLSGDWEIQEEDKTYHAMLDHSGNGIYSWQEGRIFTIQASGGQWEGTWHQSGNDREGGFEVILSEDRTQAQGVWWYTRVGDHKNIPPRQWGGSYLFKRGNYVGPPVSTAAPSMSESDLRNAER